MLIKSPKKKGKVRPNKRRKSKEKKKNSSANGYTKSTNGTSHGKRIKKEKSRKKRISLPRVQPWKVILGAIVIGALGILYLNHVFATQELLGQVQQVERKYNQAKRMNNDYRLTYDRMIGPADIYKKAKRMGFINGGPAEKVIEVKP